MAGSNPFDDILDAPTVETPKAPRHYKDVPLLLMIFGCILTLVVYLDIWKLLQLGAIVSFFFLPLRYRIGAVAIAFLLGSLQLLRIFPFYIGYDFGGVIVDFICLGGLAMTMYIGHEELRELVQQFRPEEGQLPQKGQYELFRKRFNKLDATEIRSRLKRTGLREDARQALEDLLSEQEAAE